MAQQHQISPSQFSWNTIGKRMFIGWILGMSLIAFFLITAGDEANPEWGAYWMLKPLIITPMAAGFGAAFSVFLDPMRRQGGWKLFAAVLLSLVVFLISLWMGSILGLNGTFWN